MLSTEWLNIESIGRLKRFWSLILSEKSFFKFLSDQMSILNIWTKF